MTNKKKVDMFKYIFKAEYSDVSEYLRVRGNKAKGELNDDTFLVCEMKKLIKKLGLITMDEKKYI